MVKATLKQATRAVRAIVRRAPPGLRTSIPAVAPDPNTATRRPTGEGGIRRAEAGLPQERRATASDSLSDTQTLAWAGGRTLGARSHGHADARGTGAPAGRGHPSPSLDSSAFCAICSRRGSGVVGREQKSHWIRLGPRCDRRRSFGFSNSLQRAMVQSMQGFL